MLEMRSRAGLKMGSGMRDDRNNSGNISRPLRRDSSYSDVHNPRKAYAESHGEQHNPRVQRESHEDAPSVSRPLRDASASRPLGNAPSPLRGESDPLRGASVSVSFSRPLGSGMSRPLNDSRSIRLDKRDVDAGIAIQPNAHEGDSAETSASTRARVGEDVHHEGVNAAASTNNPRVKQAKPTYRRADGSQRSPAVSGVIPKVGSVDSYCAATSAKRKGHRRIAAIVVGACVLVAGIVCAFVLLSPIEVTVNGQTVSVGGTKTIAEALAASSATPVPGNLVSVEGQVLQEGAGQPFYATVNGEGTEDPDRALSSGDMVVIENGHDKEEPSSVEEAPLPFGASVEGTGAIHSKIRDGVNGVQQVKTGELSGKTTTVVTQEPVNTEWKRYNADVGDEKVIALTFDDGPNSNYTTQILDILRDNGAKATFFTVGSWITGDNIGVVNRAASEGHQISTHTFDHAAGSGQGVNLGYMSDQERLDEVNKGNQAIEAAGVTPAAEVIRTPGGNFGEAVISTLSPIITDEIGWNIDTTDWQRPGVEVIRQRITSADPGEIVLMHDGGGDRSQTVQALREALPQLKSEGYRFVTINELIDMAK